MRIRGEFQNLPQADLLLYSPDGGLHSIDTLHILKGEFDYETRVDGGPYTYVIIYPNFSTLSFQAHSGSDIRIEGDALSLNQVRVEGADSVWMAEDKKGKNPLSIGKKLPESDLIKPKRGTYLLISFWADWKYGSSAVKSFTRQALAEHPDSLRAFTYSLDVDPATYQAREEADRDTTRWKTYCDYTGWGGKILSQYGIRNIPLMILVGPKGTVLGMGSDYNRDIKPHLPVER